MEKSIEKLPKSQQTELNGFLKDHEASQSSKKAYVSRYKRIVGVYH